MMHDIYGNKAAIKLYQQLKTKNYRELAVWLRTRKPRNKSTRDLLRALAEIFDDTSAIDFLSRKPSPDHPDFVTLRRRAQENLDLALKYKLELQNRTGR